MPPHPQPGIIMPPWLAYPGNPPWWGGWRQGEAEAWLLKIWFPFWQARKPAEKASYLQTFPPPDEEWQTYMTEYWK